MIRDVLAIDGENQKRYKGLPAGKLWDKWLGVKKEVQ